MEDPRCRNRDGGSVMEDPWWRIRDGRSVMEDPWWRIRDRLGGKQVVKFFKLRVPLVFSDTRFLEWKLLCSGAAWLTEEQIGGFNITTDYFFKPILLWNIFCHWLQQIIVWTIMNWIFMPCGVKKTILNS